MIYKLYKTIDGLDAAIKTNEDSSTTSFVFSPVSGDYQQYLEWLAEGNTPLPAEE